MPLIWSGSPVNKEISSSSDIRQFAKFFDMHEMDFEIRRVSGLWDVYAWTRNSDVVFAVSAKHELLDAAILDAFTRTKEQLKRS